MYIFTPNHPYGGRYVLFVKEHKPLGDNWRNIVVYLRDCDTQDGQKKPRGIFVQARRADCGLGCKCAAEVEGLGPHAAKRLSKALRRDD